MENWVIKQIRVFDEFSRRHPYLGFFSPIMSLLVLFVLTIIVCEALSLSAIAVKIVFAVVLAPATLLASILMMRTKRLFNAWGIPLKLKSEEKKEHGFDNN